MTTPESRFRNLINAAKALEAAMMARDQINIETKENLDMESYHNLLWREKEKDAEIIAARSALRVAVEGVE